MKRLLFSRSQRNQAGGCRSGIRLTSAALFFVMAALVFPGCADDDESEEARPVVSPPTSLPGLGAEEDLRGAVRLPSLQAAGLSLPEINTEPGESGTLEDFNFQAAPGSFVALHFGFANCPDICPLTAHDLIAARKYLTPEEAERIDLAFITIDPKHDTPEKLADYVRVFSDDYRAMRTDDTEQFASVTDQLGVYVKEVMDPEAGICTFAHTATVFVLDSKGEVVVEWSFGQPVELMAADMRILLARADAEAGESAT